MVGADVMGESSVASDPAMDMWAYGVIAFEVLAGKRFFAPEISDQDVMQVRISDVMHVRCPTRRSCRWGERHLLFGASGLRTLGCFLTA